MNITPATQYLSPQEIKKLSATNDLQGLWVILNTWGGIALIFTFVGLYPGVLTFILGMLLMGGRQLACAIIMHDAGHYSIFSGKKANDFAGKWFGSYPIMNDMLRYRDYHLQHHLHTGSTEDPDISLTRGYPATVASMIRKFFRDLSGLTGLKSQLAFIAMQLGYLKYSLSREVSKISQKDRSWPEFFQTAWSNLSGPLAANLIIFGILYASGNPWLYWLWIGSLLTTFSFCIRIRSISEHAMVEDMEDPRKNTRTTLARWWEKLFFAPHHVNYHLEHHMLMAVPSYNLPEMHRLLKERGFYKDALMEKGYIQVIRKAMGLVPLNH